MVSQTSEKLLVEVRGNTVLATINNPPANTWDTESLGAMNELVAQCNEDKEVYAIVVTGQGGAGLNHRRRPRRLCCAGLGEGGRGA